VDPGITSTCPPVSSTATSCALADQRGEGGGAVGARGEVAPAVTVGRAEAVNRARWESVGDRTLHVGVDAPNDAVDPGVGVAEQVVDVPVAHVVFAAGGPAVAVDAGEPPVPSALPVYA